MNSKQQDKLIREAMRRVSTLNNGQGVSMQVREFEEFCASRKWTIGDRYIDSGISGSKDHDRN